MDVQPAPAATKRSRQQSRSLQPLALPPPDQRQLRVRLQRNLQRDVARGAAHEPGEEGQAGGFSALVILCWAVSGARKEGAPAPSWKAGRQAGGRAGRASPDKVVVLLGAGGVHHDVAHQLAVHLRWVDDRHGRQPQAARHIRAGWAERRPPTSSLRTWPGAGRCRGQSCCPAGQLCQPRVRWSSGK